MPLATLKYPRSITKLGKTFFQGVSLPISDEVAIQLRDDKRFDVKGLQGDVAEDRARLEATSGGRPHVRAVRLEHIRLANDTLDPDVTTNYEVNGLPSIGGLAKAMGWTPDENEIREALRIKRRTGELGVNGDAGDRVIRTRRAPEPPISRRLSVAQQEAMIESPEEIPDKIPDDERVPTISMSESGAHFVNVEQIPPHVAASPAEARPKAIVKKQQLKFVNVKNRGRNAPVIDKTKGAVDVT